MSEKQIFIEEQFTNKPLDLLEELRAADVARQAAQGRLRIAAERASEHGEVQDLCDKTTLQRVHWLGCYARAQVALRAAQRAAASASAAYDAVKQSLDAALAELVDHVEPQL